GLELVVAEQAPVKGHLDLVPVAGCLGVGGDTIDTYDTPEGVPPFKEPVHHVFGVDESGGAAIDDLGGSFLEQRGILGKPAQDALDGGLRMDADDVADLPLREPRIIGGLVDRALQFTFIDALTCSS